MSRTRRFIPGRDHSGTSRDLLPTDQARASDQADQLADRQLVRHEHVAVMVAVDAGDHGVAIALDDVHIRPPALTSSPSDSSSGLTSSITSTDNTAGFPRP